MLLGERSLTLVEPTRTAAPANPARLQMLKSRLVAKAVVVRVLERGLGHPTMVELRCMALDVAEFLSRCKRDRPPLYRLIPTAARWAARPAKPATAIGPVMPGLLKPGQSLEQLVQAQALALLTNLLDRWGGVDGVLPAGGVGSPVRSTSCCCCCISCCSHRCMLRLMPCPPAPLAPACLHPAPPRSHANRAAALSEAPGLMRVCGALLEAGAGGSAASRDLYEGAFTVLTSYIQHPQHGGALADQLAGHACALVMRNAGAGAEDGLQPGRSQSVYRWVGTWVRAARTGAAHV